MKLPPLEYACPASLSEAVALLASAGGDARAIAGGQSLMPMLAFRVVAPTLLVDLRKLPGLKEIKISADGVRLGAMVRWRDIEDDARLATAHPLLKAAVEHVAHYQIRNRGTVGGSIAHADPAAEMPGIAVTCDAEIAVDRREGVAHDPRRRLLRRGADDRARARRDHHRDQAAGLAGEAPLGLPRVLAPPRRFRDGGGGAVLRPGCGRQGDQRPCRHHRPGRSPAPPAGGRRR